MMTDRTIEPMSEFEVALIAAARIYVASEDGYARIPGRRGSNREISAATVRYVCEQSHSAMFVIVYPDHSPQWFMLREGRVEPLRRVTPEDELPWASDDRCAPDSAKRRVGPAPAF